MVPLSLSAALLLHLAVAGPRQPASARTAPPPERFARYVEGGATPNSLDDLGHLLHIQHYKGRVELNSGFSSASLRLAAYRAGKEIELAAQSSGTLGAYETNGTIRYAIDIADLDYLPLGGGRKGYCRLSASFKMPDGSWVWTDQDIPKSQIDLSNCSQFSFSERAATAAEVPLLWFKSGANMPLNLVTTRDVISNMGDGTALIVSLRFDDQTVRSGGTR